MAYKKELSTECKGCGVKWKEDYSNKYPKRAVCLECIKVEYEERKEQYKNNQFKRGLNRFEKHQPFKIENRKHIHKAVNLELRKLKDRTEIREFLRKRFDELLEDKALWDYLNDTDVENKYEN
jgi:recombinational DNA repair protein (RecF pathway)